MARVPGFEPGNNGSKDRRLTAWPHPIINQLTEPQARRDYIMLQGVWQDTKSYYQHQSGPVNSRFSLRFGPLRGPFWVFYGVFFG